jgi:hypothetical protein
VGCGRPGGVALHWRQDVRVDVEGRADLLTAESLYRRALREVGWGGRQEMAVQLQATESAPEWLAGDMPQGYQNRLAEIERLSAELRAMDQFGRVMWAIGDPLERAVRDVFHALRLESEPLVGSQIAQVIVPLDGHRRLLLHIADAESAIQKASPALEQVFHLVHKHAGDEDRVVLVANVDRLRRPVERSEPLTLDAVALLKRLGANFLPASHLFSLWKVGLQDSQRARVYVDRLHAQDGGVVPAPAI